MELSSIGYFSKVRGVKGSLILRVENHFDLEQLKVLFVEVAGAKAPYFLSTSQQISSGIIISLEDIDTIEKARTLVGKKVFIDSQLLHKEETGLDFLGYELIDKHEGLIGNVISVTDNGHQFLINIDHGGKEVILPWVDDFIEKVDKTEKKIYFNAPAGLIDVYLGRS